MATATKTEQAVTTQKPKSVAELHKRTTNEMSELRLELENTRNELRAAKTHPNFDGRDTPLLKVILCIVAGCTTPLLCLAMSTLMGHVATGSMPVFALAPASVLLAMLIVSTPHIAHAKKELQWKPWQAWAFAIGLDAAITVCECIKVWCSDSLTGIEWLPIVVIVGSVMYSAFLNSYVNLLDAGYSKVQDKRTPA